MVRTYLKKRAESNPDSRILIFYACAGHGMQLDGMQVLVINQCNDKIGFYEWWGIEADIRRMAKGFPNTFSVAIFACCREVYSPSRHCGLVGGTDEAALEYFRKFATVETEAQFAREAITKNEVTTRKKELQAHKFRQIQAIEENKIKAKCK